MVKISVNLIKGIKGGVQVKCRRVKFQVSEARCDIPVWDGNPMLLSQNGNTFSVSSSTSDNQRQLKV